MTAQPIFPCVQAKCKNSCLDSVEVMNQRFTIGTNVREEAVGSNSSVAGLVP